jgi:triosephosphate isomerase
VFGETDEDVARKVEAALTEDLIPVVCVGETLDERKGGRLEEVILRQLNAVLPSFKPRQRATWMVAYEPVWAIGTGETATPADASEAHAMLRARLIEELGEERGGIVPILYGGSVKPGNARDLLQAPHVGGVLVGGASLEPSSFAGIAEAAVAR